MASRATASLNISFALVNIPVKSYLAASQEKVRFNLMNPETGARIREVAVDSVTGQQVDKSKLVRGYEYAKNNYVTFTKDELNALESARLNTVDIQECVPFSSVDLIQIEKSYYLAPDKGADKSYKLFLSVLEKKKLVAIGKYYARGRDYLVAIRPQNGCLIMHQLYFAHEVREPKTHANISISGKEEKLAIQFVDKITNKNFDPSIYHDEYTDRVREAVDQKVNGQDIVISPEQIPSAASNNLIDALKESLKTSKSKKPVKKTG